MTDARRLRLADLRDLAHRFVPEVAAHDRLYTYGARSWWPTHEIGHFLVATPAECRQLRFGIDDFDPPAKTRARYRYVVAKEIAATAISQRLLRRAGHTAIADAEIEYTDETVLECALEPWCRRAVRDLLRRYGVTRLPVDRIALTKLLIRATRARLLPEVG